MRLFLLFDALAESVATAPDEEVFEDADVDTEAVRAGLLAAVRP